MNVIIFTILFFLIIYSLKNIIKINTHWTSNILAIISIVYCLIVPLGTSYAIVLLMILFHTYKGLLNIIVDYIHDSNLRNILNKLIFVLCLSTFFNFVYVIL